MLNEDSDVKIFIPSKHSDQDLESISAVEEMNYHRQNGNVDKAKQVGAFVAELAFESGLSEKLSDEVFLSDQFYPQLCALMLFSAEAALNYYLPSQQLSATAINALHESLIEKNHPVYDTVMESPAFSFYHLSVKKGGTDIPTDIGEAFAMLCRQESNAKFIEQGRNLYTMILGIIEAKIVELKFEN